jgi:Holliday junction DNA helicase RuvB
MSAGDYELTPENIRKWSLKLNTISNPFQPQTLEEYVGQAKAKRIASIIVEAALKDGHSLPSTLITGQYGQGKTSLARIMASAYDPKITLLDAASVNKNPVTKGTYIIDEIHNLGSDVCDSLNILLDAGDIFIIGSTTDPGKLPAAFRSRFRQIYLEPYSIKDISTIIKRVIDRKLLSIDPGPLLDIAKRSRLNPRAALNYLAFIFDIATLKNVTRISSAIVKEAFQELGVDARGFQSRDYVYLNALPTDGRAVGLQYISAITRIDEETIKEEVEPYLLQQGLIDRTSKGRKLIKAVI